MVQVQINEDGGRLDARSDDRTIDDRKIDDRKIDARTARRTDRAAHGPRGARTRDA